MVLCYAMLRECKYPKICIVSLINNSVTHFFQVTGFGLYHSYVTMNVTNRNQSFVKSEIRHYFISLTVCCI